MLDSYHINIEEADPCAAIGTGYRKAVCLESLTGDNAVAAAIWRPQAASQDDLARKGLAHLRSVLVAAA